MTPYRFSLWAFLILALVSAGCGSSTGNLKGKVYYDNQIVVFGSVVAVGADRMPHTTAIQRDGSYYFEGLPAGEIALAVHSPEPKPASQAQRDEAARVPKGEKPPLADEPPLDPKLWRKLPEIYSDLEKSRLTAQVQPNGTTTRDLLLEKDSGKK